MWNYQQVVNKSILFTFVIDYEEQTIIYDFPGIPGIPGKWVQNSREWQIADSRENEKP